MLLAPRWAAVLASGGRLAPAPPGIGRIPARRLARQELARSIYRPSLWHRINDAINRFLNRVLGSVGPQHAGWWALVVLVVVVVVVIAAVLLYVGPARRTRRQRAGAVLAGTPLTAADHRREAGRLAVAGDYAGAIIERVRAIAVELESRGILVPRPGRTASELATEAATALPGSAVALRDAARLFDDVRYGGRAGTPAGYQQVSDLDAAVQAARSAVTADGGSGPGIPLLSGAPGGAGGAGGTGPA